MEQQIKSTTEVDIDDLWERHLERAANHGLSDEDMIIGKGVALKRCLDQKKNWWDRQSPANFPFGINPNNPFPLFWRGVAHVQQCNPRSGLAEPKTITHNRFVGLIFY